MKVLPRLLVDTAVTTPSTVTFSPICCAASESATITIGVLADDGDGIHEHKRRAAAISRRSVFIVLEIGFGGCKLKVSHKGPWSKPQITGRQVQSDGGARKLSTLTFHALWHTSATSVYGNAALELSWPPFSGQAWEQKCLRVV